MLARFPSLFPARADDSEPGEAVYSPDPDSIPASGSDAQGEAIAEHFQQLMSRLEKIFQIPFEFSKGPESMRAQAGGPASPSALDPPRR